MTDQPQKTAETQASDAKASPKTIWDELAPGAHVIGISVGSPTEVAAMERAGLPLATSIGNILNAVARGLAESRPDILIKPYSAQLALLPGNKMGATAIFFRRAAGDTGPMNWRAEEEKQFFNTLNSAPPQAVTARSVPVATARCTPRITGVVV